eukprot:488980-Amphidinium_carterae.1
MRVILICTHLGSNWAIWEPSPLLGTEVFVEFKEESNSAEHCNGEYVLTRTSLTPMNEESNIHSVSGGPCATQLAGL